MINADIMIALRELLAKESFLFKQVSRMTEYQ